MKGNKGITLIALVITIIVLLILAGVSIAMLTGDNSILKRGTQASVQNKLGAANDAVSLYVSDKVAEFYEAKYAKNNTVALGLDLNGYLANADYGVKNSDISPLLDAGVSLNQSATALNADGTGSIVLEYNDNGTIWQSTGTVNNGKITWKIEEVPSNNNNNNG